MSFWKRLFGASDTSDTTPVRCVVPTLHDAAQNNDLQTLRHALAVGVTVNDLNARRETPLYVAVSKGHLDVVEYLLQHGGDPNIMTARQIEGALWVHGVETPLIAAIRATNNERMVSLLLQAGADPSLEGESGTPLQIACGFNTDDRNVGVARMLLEAGARVSAGTTGDTPLHRAAQFGGGSGGSVEMVELLLNAGVDQEARNRDGELAVHCAIRSGKGDVARLLTERLGHPPGLSTPQVLVSLREAAGNGDVDSVRSLIAQGAPVVWEEPYSRTNGLDHPLALAVWRNRPDVVEILLTAGTPVNGVRNLRPLYEAVTVGALDCAKVLLAHGADPSLPNYGKWGRPELDGETSLEAATRLARSEMINLFRT